MQYNRGRPPDRVAMIHNRAGHVVTRPVPPRLPTETKLLPERLAAFHEWVEKEENRLFALWLGSVR